MQANDFTRPLLNYCNGDASDLNCPRDACMMQGRTKEFFWTNFIQPTTRVRQVIAADMKATINKHFGI
jgi:hypothetical protein